MLHKSDILNRLNTAIHGSLLSPKRSISYFVFNNKKFYTPIDSNRLDITYVICNYACLLIGFLEASSCFGLKSSGLMSFDRQKTVEAAKQVPII